MYTKKEILKFAHKYLAKKYNCEMSTFEKQGNTLALNHEEDCFLRMLCIGGHIIVSADAQMASFWENNLEDLESAWLFEYGTLKQIDKKVQEFGHELIDVHHYYLPSVEETFIEPIVPVKWYEQSELGQFEQDNPFGQALVFDEQTPDILAVAAFDGEKIIGMAGATQDDEMLWQIGVEVLPAYEGKGIGMNLVALLKQEVLRRGKIPFYGTVESHIHSQNIAVRTGFFPAWAEAYTDKLN